MIIHTRALVLNHIKYGETGLIATLYTEHSGRMSVLARGVYGKRNTRSALFQPLSLLEVSVGYRPGRDLHHLREASLSVPLSSIPFDPIKNGIALFLSEVLYKTLREETPKPGLFQFLSQSLQILDLCSFGTSNFHLIFLIQLSRHLGFSPQLAGDVSDEPAAPGMHLFADPSSGGTPGSDKASAEWFSRLRQAGFEQMHLLEMDHRTRNHLVTELVRWYGLHMESCMDVKSLPVLTSVFSS